MHRIFSSENILNCLSTFISGSTLWTVMPLQGYGSCMDMLHAHFHHGLPELAIALILKQVLKALVYLHSGGVIHRLVCVFYSLSIHITFSVNRVATVC